MTDIVQRLRRGSRGDLRRTCHEAADLIEAMREAMREVPVDLSARLAGEVVDLDDPTLAMERHLRGLGSPT